MTEPTKPAPNPATGGPIGDDEDMPFRKIVIRVLLIAVVAVVIFLVVMMIWGARIAG